MAALLQKCSLLVIGCKVWKQMLELLAQVSDVFGFLYDSTAKVKKLLVLMSNAMFTKRT